VRDLRLPVQYHTLQFGQKPSWISFSFRLQAPGRTRFWYHPFVLQARPISAGLLSENPPSSTFQDITTLGKVRVAPYTSEPLSRELGGIGCGKVDWRLCQRRRAQGYGGSEEPPVRMECVTASGRGCENVRETISVRFLSPPSSPRLLPSSLFRFPSRSSSGAISGDLILPVLRVQIMDPQDLTSLVYPERRPTYIPPHLRLPPSDFRRSIRPTDDRLHVYEQSSTPFAHANLDEPTPHQQEAEQPPRPPNAWILFRSHMARERTDLERRSQAEISAIISKAWRDATPDVKLHFEMLADAKKVEHQARYPDYRFKPLRKSEWLRDRTRRLEEARRDLGVFEETYRRADSDIRDREARSERRKQALRNNLKIQPIMVRLSTRYQVISRTMMRLC